MNTRQHHPLTRLISLGALTSLSLVACLEIPQSRQNIDEQITISSDEATPEKTLSQDMNESPLRDMQLIDGDDMKTVDMMTVDMMTDIDAIAFDMDTIAFDIGVDMEADSLECDGEAPSCTLSQGVCEDRFKVCYEGSWTECIPQDFGEDYEQVESRCDCLDNDCDGLIDEDGFGGYLSCTFDQFRIGPHSQCVLRQSSVIESGTYLFQSLQLDEDVELVVSPDSTAGFPSNEPCNSTPYAGGGGVYIEAESIRLMRGSVINASVHDSITCTRNSSTIGLHGASGGDIHLYARDINLNGSLIANGGSGTSWGSLKGGAAGSIQLYSQQLIISDSGMIYARGGLPVNGSIGGSGSGRPNHSSAGSGPSGEANEERSIRLVGQVTLPFNEEYFISSLHGNGDCNGLVDMWGQAILTTRGICGSLSGQDIEQGSLAILVQPQSGSPEGLELTLSTSTNEQSTCVLLKSGWCMMRADIAPGAEVTLQVTNRIPLNVNLTTGDLFLSYGDQTSMRHLSKEVSWTNDLISDTGVATTL